MRRDMDLVRSILLELEKSESYAGFADIAIEGYSPDDISYHVLLLHEAGLIEALDLSGGDRPLWIPVRLTWDGHEFLEASRDNARWKTAKRILAEKGGGLIFEVLKQLLITLTKDAVFGGSP